MNFASIRDEKLTLMGFKNSKNFLKKVRTFYRKEEDIPLEMSSSF